jgi:hypothetical protein
MSPPLAEDQKNAKFKVRRKKTITAAQLRANRANARLSRGPVTQAGKDRSRMSACKHNLRAELPILPGENSDELNRRLDVWPGLLGAEGEIEVGVATRAVHAFWRLERADLSEDAAAEQAMLAIDKEREEREAEEVRQLEAQLDSDDDPQGVVRKLKRTPGGCRLLIREFCYLDDSILKYDMLFWSRRERLFHLLGKRLRDLVTFVATLPGRDRGQEMVPGPWARDGGEPTCGHNRRPGSASRTGRSQGLPRARR